MYVSLEFPKDRAICCVPLTTLGWRFNSARHASASLISREEIGGMSTLNPSGFQPALQLYAYDVWAWSQDFEHEFNGASGSGG